MYLFIYSLLYAPENTDFKMLKTKLFVNKELV